MCRSVLPLLVTLSPALLLLLPDYTNTQEEHWKDYKYGRQQDSELPDKKEFCSWKCLLFTLQWPGAFCQSLHQPAVCMIPQNVNNWTIHGLWPQDVMDCCRCWPMFKSDVQELEAELNEHWPSLLKNQSSFHFWRDEWLKHGACAACVEGMNSPLRYFQINLKLRAQFDIHKLLEDAHISPSCDRPYKLSEVQQALVPHLGEKLHIQCVTDEKEREVWFQVKVPLSRNLTVGCDHHGNTKPHPPHGHPCPTDTPLLLLPHRPPAAPDPLRITGAFTHAVHHYMCTHLMEVIVECLTF